MKGPLFASLSLFLCLPVAGFSQAAPLQGAGNATQLSTAQNAGRIQLDLVVTDKSGKTVPDLGIKDFLVFDDNRPSKVMTFEGGGSATEPPNEVILVLDAVNMATGEVTFFRQEIQSFLRRNDGHLEEPVSIIVFTRDGMKMCAPSSDGNLLASELDRLDGALRLTNLTSGEAGELARFQLSLKWVTAVVRSTAAQPGRKLLIWGGPGWPSLDNPEFSVSQKAQQEEFGLIKELSTLLRQGRMTLYSISAALPEAQPRAVESGEPKGAGESGPSRNGGFAWADKMNYHTSTGPFQYKAYLKGVKSADKTMPANLGLRVLAVQSGGLVLGPGNNLDEQIVQCVQDGKMFYRLSFDPPNAARPNSYHDIRVEVVQKGLTVRSYTGYYEQQTGQ